MLTDAGCSALSEEGCLMRVMKSVVLTISFMGICIMSGYAELSERAPDVLPGTIPDMRNPSYWIARMDDPDGIILTLPEIKRMNE